MIFDLAGAVAAAALASASQQPAAPPASAGQEGRSPAPAERRVSLVVQALLNGSPLGDVTVETDTAGTASVDVAQLVRLLEPLVSRPTIDAVLARSGGAQLVPVADLSGEAFRLRFDLATLALQVEIPADARGITPLSLLGPRGIDGTVTPPEDVAAGVTFSIGNRIQQGRTFGRFTREPLTALAEGFVNVGGKDGLNFTFLAGVSEGGDAVRQRTTLFHDDEARAIRYSVGDIDPQSFGSYHTPTSIFGAGIERLYQEIQPYRNLRPAGRGGVAIERASRVDILVNGALFRTVNLAPGQYDLRDFPFLDGLNDVQLVVRDDSGRQETISLSFFSDVELLDPGISIFSATVGLRRDRFSNFVGTTYRDSPTISGFYQRGIDDRLTLGAALQADKRNALASAQAVFGTDFGLFGTEAAIDFGKGDSVEGAFLVNYRLRGVRNGGRSSSFDVDLQYRTAGFSPLQQGSAIDNRFSFDANARYQTSFDQNTFGTVGLGYSVGRGLQRNVKSFNAGLSRSYRRFNVNLDYNYREGLDRSDHRATVSFTWRLDRDQSIQGRYDTDRNRVVADYSLQGIEGLGQTNAQVSLSRDDDGQGANVDLEHYSNRFRAFAQHDYQRVAGDVQQTTDLGLSFGLGYAGGKLALGRDAARGFTIVAAHPTLQNSEILAFDRFSEKPSAKTGALGPALVPTRRPYAFNSIEVKVNDLPPGYDIGPGRIDIIPGAVSGYLFTIGSAASNTVMGVLVNAQGEPAQFISGVLRPVDAGDAPPVPFFTNRTGRMVAQKVAPGRYLVVPMGRDEGIAEIAVPENPEGPINVGTLTIKGD